MRIYWLPIIFFLKDSAVEVEELNKFFFKLTNIAVVIRLDVGLAQDAYKLFETINNRGLKLTPTDIIKNFLLGHAAKINSDITLTKVKELWSGIILNLDKIDTDDFLRQFICSELQRKITFTVLVQEFKKYYLKHIRQAELLGEYEYYLIDDELRDDEDELPFENGSENVENGPNENKTDIVEFLQRLKELSEVYKNITNASFGNIKIDREINNLNRILSKPSYIFLMHFLKLDTISVNEKVKILKYLETLMLRRHICERRTSENDDMFAKMIKFIEADNLLETIKKYIEENDFLPLDIVIWVNKAWTALSAPPPYAMASIGLHNGTKWQRHESLVFRKAAPSRAYIVAGQSIERLTRQRIFPSYSRIAKLMGRVGSRTDVSASLNSKPNEFNQRVY